MKAAIKQLIKPALVSISSSFGPHVRGGPHPRLWLLMYHRVLPHLDPRFKQEEPGMLIQPDTLDMHIQEIRRQFELISLGDWVTAAGCGDSLPDKACAITFDDGWADNYEYAFPVLKARSAPATLFAVAEKIGTDFQFWPNIVAMLLLSDAARKMAQHPALGPAIGDVAGTPTADQIAAVIQRLKQSSDAQIFAALAEINWQSLCEMTVLPALMNWNQLREMQTSGLIEIGSHTCTHRRLTNTLSQAELEYEIVRSKGILQEQLKSPVNLFCFPNGDYNAAALSLVAKNYKASVTTRRGINQVDKLKMHELTRIGLHDEVSSSRRLFRARLSGWI